MDESTKEKCQEFETRCELILQKQSSTALRAYARGLGVPYPTKKRQALIVDIISALCEGRVFTFMPTTEEYLSKRFLADMDKLRDEFFGAQDTIPTDEGAEELKIEIRLKDLTPEQKERLTLFLKSFR